MTEYRWYQLADWLEPLLSDAEFAVSELLTVEAQQASLLVPTGDHWS